nr:MAG TPA: hypothetical protein [Caudoviricetes sp.]
MNINFAINIDSTDSKYIKDNDTFEFRVYFTQTSPNMDVYSKYIEIEVKKIPYRVNFSVPINDFVNKIEFGNNSSAKIYPNLWCGRVYHSISGDKMVATAFGNKYFEDTTVTIYK